MSIFCAKGSVKQCAWFSYVRVVAIEYVKHRPKDCLLFVTPYAKNNKI